MLSIKLGFKKSFNSKFMISYIQLILFCRKWKFKLFFSKDIYAINLALKINYSKG